MKLNFTKELVLSAKKSLKWPDNHLGIVIFEEMNVLRQHCYSIPKLYIFAENQRILVVEWPRLAKFPVWKRALESFRRWLVLYDKTASPVYGYMLAWSSQLKVGNCVNIVYTFKESVTGAYFKRNYVYPYDKIGDVFIPGTLRRGGFGPNKDDFYNLFEDLKNQTITGVEEKII